MKAGQQTGFFLPSGILPILLLPRVEVFFNPCFVLPFS